MCLLQFASNPRTFSLRLSIIEYVLKGMNIPSKKEGIRVRDRVRNTEYTTELEYKIQCILYIVYVVLRIGYNICTLTWYILPLNYKVRLIPYLCAASQNFKI